MCMRCVRVGCILSSDVPRRYREDTLVNLFGMECWGAIVALSDDHTPDRAEWARALLLGALVEQEGGAVNVEPYPRVWVDCASLEQGALHHVGQRDLPDGCGSWCAICRSYVIDQHTHCYLCGGLRGNPDTLQPCTCSECRRCAERMPANEMCPDCEVVCNSCCSSEAENESRQLTRRTREIVKRREKGQRLLGAEIEVSAVDDPEPVDTWCKKWTASIVDDGSVSGIGAEIVTSPASGSFWRDMMTSFHEASGSAGLDVDNSCGLHLHVDASDFQWWDMRKLVLLYSKVEESLFRMISPHRRTNTYCIPNSNAMLSAVDGIKDTKKLKEDVLYSLYGLGKGKSIANRRSLRRPGCRYTAFNLHSWLHRGTVEFRMHHGTADGDVIRRWGLVCQGLVDFAAKYSESEIRALSKSLRTLRKTCISDEVNTFITTQRAAYYKYDGGR